MAQRRVEFQLMVHGSRSYDDSDYLIVRSFSEKAIASLGVPRSWHHRWDDGWSATVSGRIMKPGARKRKSAGFQAYDWMVDRIIRWGDTRCRCEWRSMAAPYGYNGGWEECRFCRTSRETDESKTARALMGIGSRIEKKEA